MRADTEAPALGGSPEAVREGYLVDYDVVTVNSDVRMNGVFLEEGAPVDSVDPVSGARQLDQQRASD